MESLFIKNGRRYNLCHQQDIEAIFCETTEPYIFNIVAHKYTYLYHIFTCNNLEMLPQYVVRVGEFTVHISRNNDCHA